MASKKPTQAQVAEFEMLWPILKSLLAETKELSKKKADNPLNKLKIVMINKVLEHLKAILSNDPVAQFLELLDNETLPSNSDAVYVMAQYDAAMEQFKDKHYEYDEDEEESRWLTSN
jgi:hypothetical protein